jgi:hypothetical protein
MEISIVTPPGQRGSFTIGSREQGLSLEDLPERHLKLLDEPVTAGMSCVNGNGTIHTSPVWVSRDKAEILLNSVRGRQKDPNLRLRRHVSLLFMDPADPSHRVDKCNESKLSRRIDLSFARPGRWRSTVTVSGAAKPSAAVWARLKG